MTLRRRDFLLGTGAACAAIGLAPRRARGGEPVRASRVLLLNAGGGLRSTAAFHASPKQALNPWGMLAAPGALRLGAVLRADETAVTYDAPSWPGGGTVPRIDQAAAAFAVIAAADHEPDGSGRAGDHNDD